MHGCRFRASTAPTGAQESLVAGAVVQHTLALVHHGDALARENFRCILCLHTARSCRQKHAELASGEPHRAVGTEYEPTYP